VICGGLKLHLQPADLQDQASQNALQVHQAVQELLVLLANRVGEAIEIVLGWNPY